MKKKKIIIAISIIISLIIIFLLTNSCISKYKSAKIFDERFNNDNFYGQYLNGQYDKSRVYGYKVAVQISKDSKIKSFFDIEGSATLTSLLEAKYGLKVESDECSHGNSTILFNTNDKAIILIAPEYSKEEIVYFLTTPKIIFKKLDANNHWQDTGINSRYIKKAVVTNENDVWKVDIKFNKAGTKKFTNLTKELIGQKLGIFYAEQLIIAPKITEPIESGHATIARNKGLTLDEARQITNAINNRLDLDVLEIKENIK